jgi:uncharacterized protein YyaL (SSP411 family)
MANALAGETSPYLLQHQDNPVDWLPWGEEALARARERDRPLLVSIGYSACHWCHVMERECFEDPVIAALMNRLFVCVKVDREERPDVDALYVEAVQAMTGGAGWPLHVFLTPDQVPFYGGTYFPPRPAGGLPSWPQILEAVAQAWDTQRDEVLTQGEALAGRLGATATMRPRPTALEPGLLDEAQRALATGFDHQHGGFGGAPKFPPHAALVWLLERATDSGQAAEMALGTLRAMAAGGMHDQVGGGFARYSVDAAWTVPHFEKMLSDNALLLRAYAMGWRLTGDEALAEVARGIHAWLRREMAAPDGGWFAALDADTDGVEGATYLWTVAELREALGPDADAAIAWMGATEHGNFRDPHHPVPGRNVLTARGPRPPQTEAIRAALLARRATRPQPGIDDKRLTSWNALTAGALAWAGAALGDAAMLDDARATGEFLLRVPRDADGRLLRSFSRGAARLPAVLDDHAHLLEALLDLWEATFEPRWFAAAREIAGQLLERFADPEHGGFFQTAADAPALVARRRDLEDHPAPSGSSSAALGLLRLGALTGEGRWTEAAVSHLRLLGELPAHHPQAFAWALRALAFHVGEVREVAVVRPQPGRDALVAVVREALRPQVVVAAGEGPADEPPLLRDRTPRDERAAAYVCQGFACRAPVTAPEELRALLA